LTHLFAYYQSGYLLANKKILTYLSLTGNQTTVWNSLNGLRGIDGSRDGFVLPQHPGGGQFPTKQRISTLRRR
jgi:hypothetical protein